MFDWTQVSLRVPLHSELFHFNNNRRRELKQQRLQERRQQDVSEAQRYQGIVSALERQISELRLEVCPGCSSVGLPELLRRFVCESRVTSVPINRESWAFFSSLQVLPCVPSWSRKQEATQKR